MCQQLILSHQKPPSANLSENTVRSRKFVFMKALEKVINSARIQTQGFEQVPQNQQGMRNSNHVSQLVSCMFVFPIKVHFVA